MGVPERSDGSRYRNWTSLSADEYPHGKPNLITRSAAVWEYLPRLFQSFPERDFDLIPKAFR